jgi:hypothetical protein
MKTLIYTEEDGHQRRSLVKNEDPDNMAECGVPAGPPDVRLLDMDKILLEINHVLVDLELFDWDDVQRYGQGIQPAVNVFKRALINLYRQERQKLK